MSEEMNQAFQSLFFGDGYIIGFILIVILVLVIAKKNKLVGAISFIPQLLMAFDYFDNATNTNNLYWLGILMFFVMFGSSVVMFIDTRN